MAFFLQRSFSLYQGSNKFVIPPTQIRFPIGGKPVTCRGSKLTNSLGQTKLTLGNNNRSCSLKPWQIYEPVGIKRIILSGHHLLHDRASKGMGLFQVWRHKLLCMHVYKDLLRCKSIWEVIPGMDPCLLLARSWNRFSLHVKRLSVFPRCAKIHSSEKNILGLGAL